MDKRVLRKISREGRIVLPPEFMEHVMFEKEQEVMLSINEKNEIVVAHPSDVCYICGISDMFTNYVEVNNLKICETCLREGYTKLQVT